ncbi:phage tail protein [Pantoea ananatis]|uniref:phage tail protein n=1 Tax=Pantoea ananas TaxID=553 RepID=UPI001B30552C|nr:phage tail protein [Pantoea ananatis]
MLKADLLRTAIVAQQPWFRDNPDRLEVYVTSGKVMAGGTASASYRYEYELNVLAMDYPYDLDSLTVPVLAWARRHQPALLLNPELRRDGISFDAELLSNDTADILFNIKASEMVIVTFGADGKPQVKHRDEPVNAEVFPPGDAWSLIATDEVQDGANG